MFNSINYKKKNLKETCINKLHLVYFINICLIISLYKFILLNKLQKIYKPFVKYKYIVIIAKYLHDDITN